MLHETFVVYPLPQDSAVYISTDYQDVQVAVIPEGFAIADHYIAAVDRFGNCRPFIIAITAKGNFPTLGLACQTQQDPQQQ